MTIGYLVVETEFQYNDEYHYSDSHGGNPVKVFMDKAKAESEAHKRNISAIQNNSLECYLYDGEWESLFDDPQAAATKYNIDLNSPDFVTVPTDPALLDEFAKDCKLDFYKVMSVEID